MNYQFDTLAIPAGQADEERKGAAMFPVFQSSTFDPAPARVKSLGQDGGQDRLPAVKGERPCRENA